MERIRISILTLLLFLGGTANAESGMSDLFFRSGKYMVVVAIMTIIFIGIVAYLISLDKKVSKLEKNEE